MFCVSGFLFFFKQKTAYEMRISDWSSDVCSSDLIVHFCKYMDGLTMINLSGATTGAAFADVCISLASRNLSHSSQNLIELLKSNQIGRASCRERVCQYV